MLLLFVSGLVLAGLVTYWFRMGVLRSGNYETWQLPVLPIILLSIVFVDGDRGRPEGSGEPMFIAIVADVSLSMGTTPQPEEHREVGSRMERARRALLPLLGEVETSGLPVMFGITVFTARAETLLSWDDNLPQIREAIEHVIAPGLLTESGSDLAAALEGAERLFSVLPQEYRNSETAKFLILVSDGEQTVNKSDLAEPIATLRGQGVKIISLHVGLADIPEGLPLYDAAGSFVGFDPVGDQLFSVPDQGIMRLVAQDSAGAGVFVKAEGADAVPSMMHFIGMHVDMDSGLKRVALLLLLWGVTGFALLRYV